jgi:undecaprenyl-diphosphatase
MKPSSKKLKLSRRTIVLFLIMVLAIYVVVPQIGNFSDSLNTLQAAQWGDIVWAFAAVSLTYFAAGASYKALRFKPLPYFRTSVVQLASMFANRLLPAGIGGMGVNYQYLRRQRHTQSQALTMIAVNNTLGVVGNVLLVLVCLAGARLAWPSQATITLSPWLLAAVVTGAVIALSVGYHFRKPVGSTLRAVAKNLRSYRRRPIDISVALAAMAVLAFCNALGFWLCAQAVGADINFGAALIVLNLSVVLGAIVPTPGGIGGVEAGLVAGMVAYDVPAATALAAALAYRLLSFWLPLILGGLTFAVVSKRRYI